MAWCCCTVNEAPALTPNSSSTAIKTSVCSSESSPRSFPSAESASTFAPLSAGMSSASFCGNSAVIVRFARGDALCLGVVP